VRHLVDAPNLLDLGRQPGFHRSRARDLTRLLNRRAFFQPLTIRIEVEARARGWIPREIHQFPCIAADPLLTMDVVGDIGKPQSVTLAQLPAFNDAKASLAWLRAIVLASPENMTVAPADDADHAPRIVIVHRRWSIGGKARDHQR